MKVNFRYEREREREREREKNMGIMTILHILHTHAATK